MYFVIPGRAEREPGIHFSTVARGPIGFRVHRFAAPRNDEERRP